MARTLSIRPRAWREMVEAAAWYAAEGVSPAFRQALDGVLQRIQENPLQYQRVYGELRRARLQRFPYALIYSVDDRQVVVLRCIHGRRDPRRWMRRT